MIALVYQLAFYVIGSVLIGCYDTRKPIVTKRIEP